MYLICDFVFNDWSINTHRPSVQLIPVCVSIKFPFISYFPPPASCMERNMGVSLSLLRLIAGLLTRWMVANAAQMPEGHPGAAHLIKRNELFPFFEVIMRLPIIDGSMRRAKEEKLLTFDITFRHSVILKVAFSYKINYRISLFSSHQGGKPSKWQLDHNQKLSMEMQANEILLALAALKPEKPTTPII